VLAVGQAVKYSCPLEAGDHPVELETSDEGVMEMLEVVAKPVIVAVKDEAQLLAGMAVVLTVIWTLAMIVGLLIRLL
jgi:hypothetical protein